MDGIRYAVMTQQMSNGRLGPVGLRRYNFDDLGAALRRYQQESANQGVHKVELCLVIGAHVREHQEFARRAG